MTIEESVRRKRAREFPEVYSMTAAISDGSVAHVECLIAMRVMDAPDMDWLQWFFWFLRRERVRAQQKSGE